MAQDQDAIFNGLDEIRGNVSYLYSLANAFNTTGNTVMSDRLANAAADIAGAVNAIRDAYLKVCHGRYKDAEQATANMLGMAIALTAPRV